MDGDGDDDHDDDLHEAVMTCANTYYALEDRRPVYSNFFHSCISRWPAYSTAGGRPYSCKAVTTTVPVTATAMTTTTTATTTMAPGPFVPQIANMEMSLTADRVFRIL